MDKDLKDFLKNEFGFTRTRLAKLEEAGIASMGDLEAASEDDLIAAGVPAGLAAALAETLAEKVEVSDEFEDEEPAEGEIAGEVPTADEINGFAGTLGMDSNMLMMFMMSGKSDMDIDFSSMMPLPVIVGGYNPKLRNMNLMVMGQIENRYGGAPIVAINADGSVNHEVTVQYVMSLEEGFDFADGDTFYDEDGVGYELIKVGVDAQSIYPADPVNPSTPLAKSGMGTGRVNWKKAPMDVRQLVYFAATQTNELDPGNAAQMTWLRTQIKDGATRLDLRLEYPEANNAYNAAFRAGTLPNLLVPMTRSPRRPERMPRRRSHPNSSSFAAGGESNDDGFRR